MMPAITTSTDRRFLMFITTVLLSVGILFPALRPLVALGIGNDTYSYILLIPAVAIAMIWLDRNIGRENDPHFPEKRFILLWSGSLLAVYATRAIGPQDDIMNISAAFFFGIAITACFCYWYGLDALRRNMFPFAFLAFMIPIPQRFLDPVILWMSEASADLVDIIFRIFHVTALRESKTIFALPNLSIEVAKQCSGIRSTTVLFIMAILGGHLYLRSSWKKIFVILLVIPVAILKNGVRIAVLAYLGSNVDRGFIEGELHRNGGVIFFLFGLMIIYAGICVLRRTEKY